MTELREKIARALFTHEWHGLSPPDVASDWDSEKGYWLGCADVVLAVPEIAAALREMELATQQPMTRAELEDYGTTLNLGHSISTNPPK